MPHSSSAAADTQSQNNSLPATAKASARSRVSNGKSLWLDGEHRGPAARRFRDLVAEIASDIGGSEGLSEGQRQIARRCAFLSVECEQIEARGAAGEQIDLDAYGRASNSLRRLFETLGLERHQRDATPSLAEYIAVMGREKAAKAKAEASDLDPVPETAE